MKDEVREEANIHDSVDAKVIRGPESWSYIRFALTFVVGIAGWVISQLLPAPWSLMLFGVVVVLAVWLFFFSGWFQDKLIRLKNRYENRPR